MKNKKIYLYLNFLYFNNLRKVKTLTEKSYCRGQIQSDTTSVVYNTYIITNYKVKNAQLKFASEALAYVQACDLTNSYN